MNNTEELVECPYCGSTDVWYDGIYLVCNECDYNQQDEETEENENNEENL